MTKYIIGTLLILIALLFLGNYFLGKDKPYIRPSRTYVETPSKRIIDIKPCYEDGIEVECKG